jgi:hypothetical protein
MRRALRPSFAVKIALLVLTLSLLYAMTFSRLVYVSIVDHLARESVMLPRFAQPPHEHNLLEWILLVLPAALGLVGAVGCTAFLGGRLRRALARPRLKIVRASGGVE